jgi:hypothetical protein
VLIIDANVDGKLNTDAMVEFIEAKLAAATATTATAN